MKLLHAADFHLDSAFDALPEQKARLRRAEQRELLGRLMELAVNEQVDLILLSGDLFDNSSAYMETAEQLLRALGSVDIPIFIAPGNHDFYSAQSAWARLELPGNVFLFTENQIAAVELPRLGLRVWGAAFTDSGCRPLLEGFEAEKRGDTLDILCIHGELGASNYNPITKDELRRSGMDYVALGHNHSFSGLLREGETFYAWPGCPEGRGFDETGEKGVIIAELAAGACELRFVPLGGRRYELLTVDVSGDSDCLGLIQAALSKDCSRDIYRIILTGERETAPELALLSRSLEDRFFSLQLRDKTRPLRDIWEGVGSDTLRGLFLTRLKKRFDLALDDDERERIVRAVRWGLAALEDREEPYEN